MHLRSTFLPSALLILGVLLSSAGCQSWRGGTFAEDAYYPRRNHYRVRTAAGAGTSPHRLLSARWILDNFRVEQGQALEPKVGRDYQTRFGLDLNNDGRQDRVLITELYDLRLVHEEDGSVIWSRTLPLPDVAGRRSLEVMAHDYVDRVAGGSYFNVDFTGPFETSRLGTRIVEEGPVTIRGSTDAWSVTFDVIALDQEEANPQYVGHRVTTVLVRPGDLTWEADGRPSTGEGSPMLIVFGLGGRAELQPAHRADFEDLLSRVALNRSE